MGNTLKSGEISVAAIAWKWRFSGGAHPVLCRGPDRRRVKNLDGLKREILRGAQNDLKYALDCYSV